MTTTINSRDDLKDGELYRPAEVAHLFPTRNPKYVRELCADGELKFVPGRGRAGKVSYWISGAAVKGWLRNNETKASKVA